MHRKLPGGLKLARTVALFTLLAGCRETTLTGLQDRDQDRDREALARLGFPVDLARDAGDHFVVDGDIIISKSELARPGLRPRRPQFQYAVDNVVDSTWGYRPVNIYFADLAAANAEWGAAVREAIAVWSTVPGTKIPFLETSERAAADIVIEYGTCDPGAIACAVFPVSGGWSGNWVGNHVSVVSAFNGLAPSSKLYTIAHELGHTIGYRHTNWRDRNEDQYSPVAQGANFIPGTQEDDPASLMNGVIGTWQGLSYYDRVAARYLWAGGRGPTPSGSMSGSGAAISWPATQDAVRYKVVYAQSHWGTCWGPFFGYYSCIQWTYQLAGSTSSTSFVDVNRGLAGPAETCWYPNAMYQIVAVFNDNGTEHDTDLGDPACYN